jgi:hypothetical protein
MRGAPDIQGFAGSRKRTADRAGQRRAAEGLALRVYGHPGGSLSALRHAMYSGTMGWLAEIDGGYFTIWPQRYASPAECGIKIPVSEMMSRVSPPREAVSRRIVALLLSLPPAPPQRERRFDRRETGARLHVVRGSTTATGCGGAGWPSSRKAQSPMPRSETERSMNARRGG